MRLEVLLTLSLPCPRPAGLSPASPPDGEQPSRAEFSEGERGVFLCPVYPCPEPGQCATLSASLSLGPQPSHAESQGGGAAGSGLHAGRPEACDRVGAWEVELLSWGHASPSSLGATPLHPGAPCLPPQGCWQVTTALVFMDHMQMAPGRSLPSRGTGSFSPRPPGSGDSPKPFPELAPG